VGPNQQVKHSSGRRGPARSIGEIYLSRAITGRAWPGVGLPALSATALELTPKLD
jgi:hypothetical protein